MSVCFWVALWRLPLAALLTLWRSETLSLRRLLLVMLAQCAASLLKLPQTASLQLDVTVS